MDHRRGRNEPGAHTEHDNGQIGFSIVAVLQRVIPAVEHLQRGRADADGQHRRGEHPLETRMHVAHDSTLSDPDHDGRGGIARLFVAQGNSGIDTHCSTGWHDARDQCRHAKEGWHGKEGEWIERMNAEQQLG